MITPIEKGKIGREGPGGIPGCLHVHSVSMQIQKEILQVQGWIQNFGKGGGGDGPNNCLRIDKGSLGGVLYSDTCIHNYGNCNGKLCIV